MRRIRFGASVPARSHRLGPHSDLHQPVNWISGFLRPRDSYGNWFRGSPDRQLQRIWHYGIERLRCQQYAGHGDVQYCRKYRRRTTEHLGNDSGGHKRHCYLQCHSGDGRPHSDVHQPGDWISGFLRPSDSYGNWFRGSPDRQHQRIWHYGIERLRCQQYADHGDVQHCRKCQRRTTQCLRYHDRGDQRYGAVHCERWRPADADVCRPFERSAWNVGQRNSHRDKFHHRRRRSGCKGAGSRRPISLS